MRRLFHRISYSAMYVRLLQHDELDFLILYVKRKKKKLEAITAAKMAQLRNILHVLYANNCGLRMLATLKTFKF